MIKKIPIPELTLPPPVSFSFSVVFFGIGNLPIPNGLDIRFQKVSGIGINFETKTEAVETSLKSQKNKTLYGNVSYQNLVLERGVALGISPLSIELKSAINNHKLKKHNILVILLNETFRPIANWMIFKAYPVNWSVSDLDATQNGILIERLEMKFEHLKSIRL